MEEGKVVSPVNRRVMKLAQPPSIEKQRRGSYIINLKKEAQPIPSNANSTEAFFHALHGRKYHRISIPKPESAIDFSNEPDYNIPVFVDGKGNYYNIYYHKISTENLLQIEGYPDPENYTNYLLFEQAVAQWYNKASQTLQPFKLPFVMGRCYYRPKTGILELQSSEALEKGEGSPSITTAMHNSPHVEDSDLYELEYDKRWNLEKDIWQTMLFPMEPLPDQFKTFEAYEESLKNWAYVCSKVIDQIPPHPSQLQDLILIKTGEQRKKAMEIQKRNETTKTEKKVGVSFDNVNTIYTGYFSLPTFQKKINDSFQPKRKNFASISDIVFGVDISEQKEKSEIDEQSIDKCSSLFGRLSDARTEMILACGSFSAPLISEVRETTPHPPMFYDDKTTTTPGVRISTIPAYSKAYSDLSLVGQVYQHQYDLEYISDPHNLGAIQSNNSNSNAAAQNLVNLFNNNAAPIGAVSNQLAPTPAIPSKGSISLARNLLLEMERTFGFDTLCSWYYSNSNSECLTTASFIERYSKEKHMLFLSVFSTAFLDNIIELFEEPYMSGENFVQFIISNLTVDSILEIIQFILLTNSELPRANIAVFVSNLLQLPISGDVLSHIYENNDYTSMYLLANCVNYFNTVAVDIFPLTNETLEIMKFRDQSLDGLLLILLNHYYLTRIKTHVESQSFLYANFLPSLTSIYDKNHEKLMTILQTANMVEKLFTLINSRSHTVSHIGLFALMFLLNSKLDEYMISNQVVEYTRKLFSSKFSHAIFAAKQIMNFTLKTETYRNALIMLYMKDTSSLLSDLRSSSTELARFSYKVIKKVLEKIMSGLSYQEMGNYPFFLEAGRDRAAFFTLLKFIFDDNDCVAAENKRVSRVLLLMIKAYRQLHLLQTFENESEINSNTLLYVHADDLVNIISHIADSGGVTETSYVIKTNLFNCACDLIKCPAIFKAISDNKVLFNKIIKCCRDGENLKFNKTAWKFFHHLIKFHSSSPTILENSKFLNNFFEIISPTMSPVAVKNSVYYISKLLQLHDNESAKFQTDMKCVRGNTIEDLKGIEKDLKAFNIIFVKHCVKVHLIYKKLLFNHHNGSAAHAIIQFYHTVSQGKSNSNTGTKKIYKELTKNKDYKLQVDQIVGMFGGFSPEKSAGITFVPNLKRGTMSFKKITNAS